MDVLLRVIAKCQADGLVIIVKLILSVDRRGSVAEAMETVHLAIELMSTGVVVGLDLSGKRQSLVCWLSCSYVYLEALL